MEAAVAKVKADAKRSDKEKSAALSEVTKLEALVAQLKQQKPQSRDQESSKDKVRLCRMTGSTLHGCLAMLSFNVGT